MAEGTGVDLSNRISLLVRVFALAKDRAKLVVLLFSQALWVIDREDAVELFFPSLAAAVYSCSFREPFNGSLNSCGLRY